jgi:hypothetical protein
MKSLGEVLGTRRRGRFVGRLAEQELFRAALSGNDAPFAVLHLHGPGGIGKTALLDIFATLAQGAGARVVRIDGRDLIAAPASFIATLRASIDVPDGDEPIRSAERLVLLVDSYEALASLDDWVRATLLPRLPATALTVIAGRTPPAAPWREDPAWHDLLRVVTLRNLDPDDARGYLDAHGVPAALQDRLLQVSHGHPLALSLLAELAARGDAAPLDPLTADLVGVLLRRFVDTIPSGPQRRALEVCALARVTTESLLRAVLGDEPAHDLFRGLLELSFVEAGPDGLFPHDLARDVLDKDLRWRDPDAYRSVFRKVAGYIHTRLKSSRGAEQRRTIRDLKFIFRNLPGILSPIDWDTWGHHDPEPARAADRQDVLQLIGRAEGEAAAAIATRWWARQPEGFHVLRDNRGLRGVIGVFDLTAASDDDRAADAGVQAAWDHARRLGPLRSGERVTATRFLVDRDTYQAPSPTMNATPIVSLQRYVAMPNIACDYLALFEPEAYDNFFAMADLPRAAGADFVVGGRRYGLFAHDFRQVPVNALVELWTERSLAQEFVPSAPPHLPAILVLSPQEFADAVRQALRDLNDSARLARNPLLRARLVRDRVDGDAPHPAALAALLREAIDTLRRHPKDHDRLLAVERTYVNPAPSQEIAAERLGRPFSTYRRHLTQGVERIVDWLWQREVHGPEPG